MKNQSTIKKRFLRDELPVRLGGLATNLMRIKSFSDNPAHREVVDYLLEESKFFIEWIIPDAELEVQSELLKIQIQLALWHLRWDSIWENPKERLNLANISNVWSKKVLGMSGLLT